LKNLRSQYPVILDAISGVILLFCTSKRNPLPCGSHCSVVTMNLDPLLTWLYFAVKTR